MVTVATVVAIAIVVFRVIVTVLDDDAVAVVVKPCMLGRGCCSCRLLLLY